MKKVSYKPEVVKKLRKDLRIQKALTAEAKVAAESADWLTHSHCHSFEKFDRLMDKVLLDLKELHKEVDANARNKIGKISNYLLKTRNDIISSHNAQLARVGKKFDKKRQAIMTRLSKITRPN